MLENTKYKILNQSNIQDLEVTIGLEVFMSQLVTMCCSSANIGAELILSAHTFKSRSLYKRRASSRFVHHHTGPSPLAITLGHQSGYHSQLSPSVIRTHHYHHLSLPYTTNIMHHHASPSSFTTIRYQHHALLHIIVKY